MRKDSILLRIVISAIVIFLLLIPLILIESLISDRQSYRDTAVAEINQSWASNQTVAGPILSIISKEWVDNLEGKKILRLHKYHLLPENLTIESEVFPETRYRGIYEVTLYKTDIKITGSFDFNAAQRFKYDEILKNLDESYLSFGLTELKGIEENIKVKWNGLDGEVNPGLKNTALFKDGFFANVGLDKENKKYNFEILLKLKGSESLKFIPLGKITTVHMKSGWSNPSFLGNFLPSSREMTPNGFKAEWKVNQFNRNYPQEWDDNTYELTPGSFGVKLLIPVDEYQKTMRTSKYGIMIILLTFVIFFMIEIFNKKALHPIQYLLIGLSLVIFYSILLALSEYMLFQYSYLISSALIICLISFYTASVFSKTKLGLFIGGILFLFYGFMYTILQLQDYSLLLGNIALFLVLSGIMFATRKINWYEVLNNENNKTPK